VQHQIQGVKYVESYNYAFHIKSNPTSQLVGETQNTKGGDTHKKYNINDKIMETEFGMLRVKLKRLVGGHC
jgi:hypothetical protein